MRHYRPISIISVFGKILEISMYNRIIPFLYETTFYQKLKMVSRKVNL